MALKNKEFQNLNICQTKTGLIKEIITKQLPKGRSLKQEAELKIFITRTE